MLSMDKETHAHELAFSWNFVPYACVLRHMPDDLRSTAAACMLLPLSLLLPTPNSPAQVFCELWVESCCQQWALPDCDCHALAAILSS
jgi:hypothetical protein